MTPIASAMSPVVISAGLDALAELTRQHPQLRPHLYEGDTLRSFVNVYLNKEDVRGLKGADTAVAESDTLMIIPAVAGG